MSNNVNTPSTAPRISRLPIELYKAQMDVLGKYAPYLECPHCKQVGFTTVKGCPMLLRCTNTKCAGLPSVDTVVFHNR